MARRGGRSGTRTATNKPVQGPWGLVLVADETRWPWAPQSGTRSPLLAVRNVGGAQPEPFWAEHAMSQYPSLWTHRDGGSVWSLIPWTPEKQTPSAYARRLPGTASHRPPNPSPRALPSSGLLSRANNTSASLSGPACLLTKMSRHRRCYLCALVMCVHLCVESPSAVRD